MKRAPIERMPRRDDACMVPRAVSSDGLFEVDGTWGTVQPIELGPGIRTIGELELLDHLERGGRLVDTRLEQFHRQGTIAGALPVAHGEILDRAEELELDPQAPTVFFCNGPQCAATPDAIRRLVDAGYPPQALLYYRGGMHDWMTLGYPTVASSPAHP